MTKFEKLIKKRPKLERQQVRSRKHLGQLEKHKDYQMRSQKHHQKEKTNKFYNELIKNKNPDEYHSDMKFARKDEKSGRTFISRIPNSNLELKKMKKSKKKNISENARSNLSLLETRENVIRNKIEDLKNELSFGLARSNVKKVHQIRVNSKEELENFSVEEHFQTPFKNQVYRYTLDDLTKLDLTDGTNTLYNERALMKKYEKLKKLIKELKVIQETSQDISLAKDYITKQHLIEEVIKKPTNEEPSPYDNEKTLFVEQFGYEEEENIAQKLNKVQQLKFKKRRQK